MIQQIKISGFKSIRELTLKLDPVTVLVGRSGTGKSNIVQAIRFLRNYLLDPQQALEMVGDWRGILPAGDHKSPTLFEIIFSLPGEPAPYTYGLMLGVLPNVFTRQLLAERLSLGGELLFARALRSNGYHWDQQPNVANPPSFSPTSMLGAFPSVQKIVYAYTALSTGIGYYHFPSSTLSTQNEQFAKNSFMSRLPGLSEDAGNYRQVMLSLVQNFQRSNERKALLASLRQVNPSILSIELDSVTNPQRAIVGHNAGKVILDLSLEQESDGVRRFFAFLLALYQSPSKLSLIFEEPENAIFPGALAVLAEEMQAAPPEGRGQVILTTHSPGLLDSFDVDNVRVVEMSEGETRVGPVSKEQKDLVKEHLLSTGELLTAGIPKMDDEPPVEQQV